MAEEEGNQASKLEAGGATMMFGKHQGIDTFSQTTLREMMGITRKSNAIPCDENFTLYSSFPAFKRIMDMEGKKCLEIIGKLLNKYNIRGGLSGRDMEEKFDLIVEANDQLLEKINGDLDEAAGMKKKLDSVVQTVSASADGIVSGRWNLTTNRTVARSASQTIRLMTASNIERPQLSFRQKVDNSSSPFVPVLTEKPHAVRPLAILLEIDDEGRERYSHPYEFELERFQPPDWALEPATEPVPPPPAEETPVTMVTTLAGLQQLTKELCLAREIAVDLEHHNYRSYLGLTCLIQISTRTRDYIVDALALRSHLQLLNEAFADPNIVKVLHGADSDVEWLQRDCGVYIVHLFDTHQASKLLTMPRLSLAYLLQHFCNVAPDKRLQLADWRIRPLPEDMMRYAQEDTHYLLYIYDMMRNLLLEKGNEQKNLIKSVYTNSTILCLKRYSKPMVGPESHLDLYRRSKKSFNAKQMAALQHLYKWRDDTARAEDESVQYVLPKHMLLQICELLPRELQGLLACCSPVPPLLRQNLTAVHKMVLSARVTQLHTEARRSEPAILVQAPTHSRTEYNSALHNPHDLSHLAEGDRVNAPLLLEPAADESMNSTLAEEMMPDPAPTKDTPDLDVSAPTCVSSSRVGADWISPYRRYLIMMDSLKDEKIMTRMAELTESTPVREAARPAAQRDSPPPSPETVLPGLQDTSKVEVEAETEKEPPVPQKLRIGRAERIQEQKEAGTYKKAKKRKRGKGEAVGAEVAPTIPLSEAGPPAQRPRTSGAWSKEPAALPADPFDYSTVDYSSFEPAAARGRGSSRGRGQGRGRGRGRGARGKRGGKNPWRQDGARQQTFSGGSGRGRGGQR